jgi:recombination protein RecR
MKIPRAVQNLIESFEKLPGVGPKSAQRLTFYLLHVPQGELDTFAKSLTELKTGTKLCSICMSIDETDPCSICSDGLRDHATICVVEQPLDVLALEKSGTYKGVYHVLHGRIDPLNNLGPDEIYVGKLFDRIKNSSSSKPSESRSLEESSRLRSNENTHIKEIILATNPTMEGEATAMYITKQLKALGFTGSITRIGRGLPVGADLEYADEVTLQRAMEGRSEV